VFRATADTTTFDEILQGAMDQQAQGVIVEDIVEDKNPPKMVYKPNHPDADKNGYVAMPNVNVVEEMANMISTSKAFEANAQALATSKSMALKALDIGRN
jgi:flagellar basal-body rod protein FlgC